MKLKGLIKLGKTASIAAIGLSSALQTNAAVFSSTKVEALYGDYDERGAPGADGDPVGDKQGILTIANASGFKYGDSYLFADIVDVDDKDETDGIHLEFGPRLSLVRAFGGQPSAGVIKDFYLIAQGDFDGNRFTQKTTLMGGISTDLNLPGFVFFKVHLQYRDDPQFDGDSLQLNLVWNAPFSIGGAKFSFEGFADWTTDEGDKPAADYVGPPVFSKTNLLVQPQLLWHITPHVGLGIEYQYWKNRLGIDGRDESTPQIMLRWTF